MILFDIYEKTSFLNYKIEKLDKSYRLVLFEKNIYFKMKLSCRTHLNYEREKI